MKSFYSCGGLSVVVLSRLLMETTALPDLTLEMFQARTLEEFRMAERKHREQKAIQETMERRHRMMQEEGLEDSQPILADQFNDRPGFYHGVASGDPLPNAVIVWTRYTPVTADQDVTLEFRMAKMEADLDINAHLDPEKNPNVLRANVIVTSQSDFVVKMDVTGLDSATHYVFAFSDGDTMSMIGRTRTAPGKKDNVESMTYAVFSCSDFALGYFHAYDVASTIRDLDFWIHLGDYVYEYGVYRYDDSPAAPERLDMILPPWEQISLQDYRNRMATYHLDEGLRNLRARAPVIACWDDHDFTNNPYGQGSSGATGALNHQEVCPVGVNATNSDKAAANCDRDEGLATKRFNSAAQSYYEWMPIRHQPGTMGVLSVGDIYQEITWGDMATIVTFDTRFRHRSRDPTINWNNYESFFPFVSANTDVTQYTNQSSPVYTELLSIAEDVHAALEDPKYTMIGDDKELVRDVFERSTSSGQPWQIWATATALGRAVKGRYDKIHEYHPDATMANAVQSFMSFAYTLGEATLFRAFTAMAITNVPWNRDDYSGFANEQREILQMLKDVATNPIILGGDLHDGYTWQLYEDGARNGTPCAVNLICPSVTSRGWGSLFRPSLGTLSSILGSDDVMFDLMEQADEAANPGLFYYNMHYKGFYAVRATKESHVAEYLTVTPETVLSTYDDARDASGSIVADFDCDTQVTTTAGKPGSLDRSDECSLIEFETVRSPTMSIPFPQSDDEVEIVLNGCDYQGCTMNVTGIMGEEEEPPKINGDGVFDGGSNGTCGSGERGNGICNDGQCCSPFGWCGNTSDHCQEVSASPARFLPGMAVLTSTAVSLGTCIGFML